MTPRTGADALRRLLVPLLLVLGFLAGATWLEHLADRGQARQHWATLAVADQTPVNERLQGYTLAALERHWQGLSTPAIQAETRWLQLDLGFPWAYGAALLAALWSNAQGTASGTASGTLRGARRLGLAGAAVLLAMAADVTENSLLLQQLQRLRQLGPLALQAPAVAAASLATQVKLLALIAALAGLIWRLAQPLLQARQRAWQASGRIGLKRLLPLSLAEWRHYPGRHAVALLAVALGVALASSVQIINESALSEFAQAVRSANGQPDLSLSSAHSGGFDDALYARLALDEAVLLASPVRSLDVPARRSSAPQDKPLNLRLAGVDGLKVGQLAPDLQPLPEPLPKQDLLATLLGADRLYLNAAAMLALATAPGQSVMLLGRDGWLPFLIAGRIAATGPALAVLDIASAQARFGPAEQAARLSRVDLRLAPGTDRADWQRRFEAAGALPAGARWTQADDAVQRVSALSRAYRVNLGVLAMVALLVGGFLVYSVVSLSVAQRQPQLALLGVLGLAAADRRRLVLAESAAIGVLGSALGLAAGVGLAALALRMLGGDLGGGYFPGVAPTLAWSWSALAACGGLGVASAVLGAWWPARQAERLQPAQALKGLGAMAPGAAARWPGLLLLTAGGLLALLPPVAGLPLAAYASVALLLAGGVALVPALVQALLGRSHEPQGALLLLAIKRAHFARQVASATVSGVVASLALSVAITVMVASFRDAVTAWLDQVLPAELYLRSSGGGGSAALPPALIAAAAKLPGVARVSGSRQLPLLVSARLPPVTLIARALGDDPSQTLPLQAAALPARLGELSVWASEPAAALHGWQAGQTITLPLADLQGQPIRATVRGVWRDYARQFGALAIDLADYRRLTGDTQINDLAFWPQPGASPAELESGLRRLAGPDLPLDIISSGALRALSLQIFDRSFAVTVYLQAVAILVGLVGVAASLSAQVLARRKEFGLLAHLGLTRSQVMRLVALETSVWLAAGVLIGLALGGAMALVLVKVVNPQSFHWSMPMALPAARLASLCAAVLAASLATALFSARRAAGRSAVLSVKEDW